MKKIKIGLVFFNLRLGGASKHLLLAARALKKQGHQVTVIAVHCELNAFSQLTRGLKIISLPQSITKRSAMPKNKLSIYWWVISYNLKILIALVKLIARQDLEVINSYDYPSNLAATLVKLLRGTPVVYNIDDIWQIPKMKKNKDQRRFFPIIERTFLWWLEKAGTKYLTDKVIVLSHWAKKEVDKSYRISSMVLPPGLDLTNFKKIPDEKNARKKLGINNLFTFLYFGVFLIHRRLEDLIEAFEKLYLVDKNIQLIIAGSDQANKQYAMKISDLCLKSKAKIIIKIGDFSEKEVVDLLAYSDVFVFTPEKQTWGMIVAEAMACAKPCIVSNECGITDILEDGKTALIFKTGDVEELFMKMKEIAIHKIIRKQIGRSAKKLVEKKLSWEKYAQAMVKVYREVL